VKILTILGTRPEIIRLSRIIPLLDNLVDHIIIHTGQNYDPNLSKIFFKELGLRAPDHVLDSKADTPMGQVGKILVGCEKIILKEKPDRILILGDTNSALSAIVAKRLGIPVFHMEAGNRCYDDRVPEEINRRIIDHSSTIHLPYTERSRANLLHEGIPGKKIYVTGNPILEVLNQHKDKIDSSDILKQLELVRGKYFLVTLHRTENVDDPERLSTFISAFEELHKQHDKPIVISVHPRTRSQLEKQGKTFSKKGIVTLDPLGLIDFVHLEKNAFCVMSDSGTVQEECAIFGVPNITLRDVTERPETLEAGSNFIAGADVNNILLGVKTTTQNDNKVGWKPPIEYLATNVSQTVVRIILGHWK